MLDKVRQGCFHISTFHSISPKPTHFFLKGASKQESTDFLHNLIVKAQGRMALN